jgi:DNA-binding LacI/PurR family transcriptional regulator
MKKSDKAGDSAIPGSKPIAHVTMADIARAIGITKSAVSLALKNHPRISQARREEIQAVAKQMGYQPNAAATALAHFKQQSKSTPIQAAIAWINAWPDPRKVHAFHEFERYWQGASKAAEKFGFRLQEFTVNNEMPLGRLKKILLTRNIRGVMIAPTSVDHEIDWTSLGLEDFCVMRIGRRVNPLHVHFVTSAQAADAILAFDKIRERGYERIAFSGSFHRDRLFGAGFQWVQQELPARSRLPPYIFHSLEPDQRELEAWLKKAKPNAMLVDNLRLPQMIRTAGYRVPEDIALAGTSVLDIPVNAGIDQNAEEIGRVSVLVMISLMNDNAQGLPPIRREILIRGKWVDGSSLPSRV